MNRIQRMMREKEVSYNNNSRSDYFTKHPSLRVDMRVTLLTWLHHVCREFGFSRDIYYLAIDFIDRYLTVSHNIPKEKLQLIGITCLFVAAKLEEEDYLPHISKFFEVTACSCTAKEIIQMESNILEALEWRVSPITLDNWLKFYLQKNECDEKVNHISTFCPKTFSRAATLLDLCVFDISVLNFNPSLLVATVLRYTISSNLATRVSGYSIEDMRECSSWMLPLVYDVVTNNL